MSLSLCVIVDGKKTWYWGKGAFVSCVKDARGSEFKCEHTSDSRNCEHVTAVRSALGMTRQDATNEFVGPFADLEDEDLVDEEFPDEELVDHEVSFDRGPSIVKKDRISRAFDYNRPFWEGIHFPFPAYTSEHMKEILHNL